MQLISHAGWGGQYVANTIPSLRRAVPRVDVIEVDLHVCGSGEVVLFHDDTLERAVGDERPISEVPWEELREMRLFDTDERIPLLEDALEAVPSDVGFNLEFKSDGLASPVRERTAAFDHDLLISSFHGDALREVNGLDWDVSTAYLFHEREGSVETALELGCEFVHPHYECCLQTDVVSAAHDEGLGVNVWTVTDESVLRTLEGQGVDGVIVDCADVLSEEA